MGRAARSALLADDHGNPVECAARRGSASQLRLWSETFKWDVSLFPSLVELAAASRSMSTVVLVAPKCPVTGDALAIAAKAGRTDVVKTLLELTAPDLSDVRLCAGAAWSGNVSMLRFLRQRRYAWDASTCSAAAGAGHLDCLRYAREEDKAQCPWDAYTIVAAAYGGHEDVLRYALKNRCSCGPPLKMPDYGSSLCGVTLPWRVFEGAVNGRQRAMAELLLSLDMPINERDAQAAALAGDLWALKRCHAILGFVIHDLGQWAARGGSVPCLEYARTCGCVMGLDVLRGAVDGRSLQCLVYAHENGISIQKYRTAAPDLCIAAASADSRECLAYVIDRVPEALSPDVLVAAIKAGSHDCARIYAERVRVAQGPNDHGVMCDLAVSHGKFECLRVAHRLGYPFSRNTCEKAVIARSVACLRYAHENGAPWEWTIVSRAVESNDLPCLRYVVQNDCPVLEMTCAQAAGMGHLLCLRYLHVHGCPWDARTCMQAASSGSLRCLIYAHENGCPWEFGVCLNAAMAGELECLVYAHENGCPWDSSIYLHGLKPACFDYILRQGCPLKSSLCTQAAEHGSLSVLQQLHESGCPWNSSCLLAAARTNHLSCFRFAEENHCPRGEAVDDALWKIPYFQNWLLAKNVKRHRNQGRS